MNFEEQIKSLNVYKDFKMTLENKKLSQAYLFMCPDRLTNKNLLLELAKLLQCENKTGCGNCPSCIKIKAGTHPDVLVYPSSLNFMVEDASKIYNNVQVKPMLSNYKVFIINDFDLSTEQAQNKMLKILEEPPSNVIFLLSTTNQEKILKTILSRVQKITVDKITKSKFEKLFVDVPTNILNVAISFGEGYLGKTLDIINNKEFILDYENMVNLIKNLKNSSFIPFYSQYFVKDKSKFENNLLILNSLYRDMLMIALNKNDLVSNANLTEWENGFGEYSASALIEILKRINLVKKKLDSNVNLTVLADNLLFDILEVKYLCK